MRQILLATAALTFVSVTAIPAEAQAPLHGSAAELEQRVIQRRAERLRSAVRRPGRSSSSARSSSSRSLSRAELRRRERLESRQQTASVQDELFAAINHERALLGHAALRIHTLLTHSAQRHADDMIARGYFAHESPEGLRVGDRVRATGYGDINAQECRCSYRISIGENLAKGQKTVNHVVQSWLASPSHREALLSDDYKDVGIGIAGDVWVLNFGGIDITTSQSGS